jgi:hypothetical protein
VLCASRPLAAQPQASPTAELHFSIDAGNSGTPVDTVVQKPRKNPTTARVLGIIPGVGHFYAGEQGRGALLLGSGMTLSVLGSALETKECLDGPGAAECNADMHTALEVLLTAATIGVIGLSIWDAGRAAERANSRASMVGFVVLGKSPSIDGADRYRAGVRLPAALGR